MSLDPHFDALTTYRAAVARVVPAQGAPEERGSTGGGLQAALEARGQRPLLGVLADPAVAEVHLEDGELSVRAVRQGAGAQLTVAWGPTVVVDEAVQLPVAAQGAGPWFRPAAHSEVDAAALLDPGRPLFAVRDGAGAVRWYAEGVHGPGDGQQPLLGSIPAVDPGDLGSAAFRETHGVRWAYIAGAMAGGIASAELVVAMAKAGLLGFFGAGGVPLEAVKAALDRIPAEAAGGAWGFNLLHNPNEPAVEEGTVDLYLQHGVHRVSASAFMGLTPAVCRYRLHGIRPGPDGRPVCDNYVFAKVSRPEVAEQFLRPAPSEMLARLVERGALTPALDRPMLIRFD